MSKFLNDKDFFMCTGGMMPTQMLSHQAVAGKEDGTKYLTSKDVLTKTTGDFVCKKLMFLMAIVAALIALTAGAGLAIIIAAAAAAGAAGAGLGALICGHMAASARVWMLDKPNAKIGPLQISAVTDKSFMMCTALGPEKISYAPFIKNWWQAILVGVNNLAVEMFKCVMAGAAVAGAAVLLTEGVGAFLANAGVNYLATWTTGWGLGFRAFMGGSHFVNEKYVAGKDNEDAALGGAGAALFGMEKGTAESAGRIATGQGTMEDAAALLGWGAPTGGQQRNNVDPNAVDPMATPWEGKPQSGKTGFLESRRMSRSEMQSFKQSMKEQGIDVVTDKKGVLTEEQRAGFNNETGTIYLRKGASNYEAFHEAQHAKQWKELGPEAYKQQSRAQREQYVYDQIMKNKDKFSAAELEHAKRYIDRVRSREGMPPVDAMDAAGGKGSKGDLFEDPAGGAGKSESSRGVTPEEFKSTVEEFKDGKNPELADRAWELFRDQKWPELEKLFKDNNLNGGWPPNRGAVSSSTTTLKENTTFDRYGGYNDPATGEFVDKGTFVAPDQVPFEQRALPDETLQKPKTVYKVLKDIPGVKEGEAIPWFEQPGMGKQYELPMSIKDLIKHGYIEKVN